MSENPYAPPAVEKVLAEDTAEEAIRRAHIKHETSIKSIGLLNYLGVIFGVLGAWRTLPSSLPALTDSAQRAGHLAGAILLPVILFVAGYSIRRLGRTGQTLSLIIYGLTLFVFPAGTIIGLIALYFLLSKKGRTVFSAPYKEIVKNTPYIRYRRTTSKAAWIILIVFLLFLVLGFFWLVNQ